MSNFKTRLAVELRDLRERAAKLDDFLLTPACDQLSRREQVRLCEQLGHMKAYESVLVVRAEVLGVTL